jgi:outer membrane protein OmpA-like peptidoglycan-associated protein
MYSTLRVPGENKVIMTVEPKKKSWYDICIEDEEQEEREKQEEEEQEREKQQKQEREKQQKQEREKQEREKQEREKQEREKQEREKQEEQKDISEIRKALFTQGKYELEEGEILE